MIDPKRRNQRLSSVIKDLAARFINSESNRQSIITVNRVEVKENLRKAEIWFSVLPEQMENAAADFLSRQTGNFRNFVKQKARLKYLPYFEFKLDVGEKNRQKIDTIIDSRK